MANALQKPKFSVAIQTDSYRRLINDTLKDPERARRFVASIISAVAVNPALQECDASTILSGALLGESLNLSPSPQLGQYYLVPFKKNEKVGDSWSTRSVATFILGYKGYLQLAIRSGQYQKIEVLPLKKGELIKYNPLTGDIEVNLIEDELKRELSETTGYYAYFRYSNGFEKSIYWSKDKMLQHAARYSQAFNLNDYKKYLAVTDKEKGERKYSSFWYKDFDAMAIKTMLRHIISHWGVMSIDMQQAITSDNAVIDQNGTPLLMDVEADDGGANGNTDLESPNSGQASDALPAEISLDDL